MIAELKIFRLDILNMAECFPAGFDQHSWYGIYFAQAPIPLIVLLHGDFDFVTQQASNSQHGFLILFNHLFLPQRLTKKLNELPLFLQQGCGPFALNLQQVLELDLLFDKIYSEVPSDYPFKKELLATLVTQLMHFVIKNFTQSHLLIG